MSAKLLMLFSLSRCTAALMSAAPLCASAIVYVGAWDPAFGPPFSDLGWRGQATIFVPDACASRGTALVSNALNCGGLAVVQAAQVQLYDLAAPSTVLNTLVFTPSSLRVQALQYERGELVALQTSVSNMVFDAVVEQQLFGLAFSIASLDSTAYQGPRLYWRDPNVPGAGGANLQSYAPPLVVTEVPEPAAWISMLGGLALLAGRARRRRRSEGCFGLTQG